MVPLIVPLVCAVLYLEFLQPIAHAIMLPVVKYALASTVAIITFLLLFIPSSDKTVVCTDCEDLNVSYNLQRLVLFYLVFVCPYTNPVIGAYTFFRSLKYS